MAKRASKSAAFDGQKGLLFATNRANMLSILSSGLIRPRAAYDKYYEDLLEHFPGHLMLFHGSFPRSLLGLLSDSEPGMFPVLCEIDPRQLSDTRKRQYINGDFVLCTDGDSNGSGDRLCDVISAPLPISAIKRLCFASQKDLEDFRAREFENTLDLPPLAALPSAFREGGPSPELFKSLSQSVAPAVGSNEEFRRLDAAMGAIAMLSLLLPACKSWVDAVAATTAYPSLRKRTAPDAPAWLSSLVESTLVERSGRGGEFDVDGRLVAAAIEFLRSANPRDGWVEAKVASAIAASASLGATSDELKEIESWRDVVIAVAAADKQVSSLDDSGSLIRRGLMLLILRCQPERIIRSSDTALRPGPQVTAVGGTLAGLFHGYSRLSREIKTQACPAVLLSRLAVSWWSAVDGKPRKLDVRTSTRSEDETTARVAVTVDGAVLLERTIRPSDAMMRLFYHAKGVGYGLAYEPDLDAFVHDVPAESGQKRRIIIESGRPTPRDQATIRIRTACLRPDGKPIRLSKREDAIVLLERNYDPVTQCLFGVDPRSGHVEVLVHQLLETMDSPELQSHIEAVGRTADEFEVWWASRLSEPQRSVSRSHQ